MHSSSGRVIYVGKAKSLKRRVSQYFLPNRDVKTSALVSHIADIEYIITTSEYEALILENNLIKKYKPRYNIDLKDDKTYQMIKITDEDFPRVIKTRRKADDKSKYFGPYPKGKDLDTYFKMIEGLFSFRRCNNIQLRHSLCIYYHIGKCSGPCVGKITKDEYMEDIIKIENMLLGNSDWIVKKLNKRLKEQTEALDFENAKKTYETIESIKKITSIQSVGNQDNKISKDYIGIYRQSSFYSIEIMQYRGGNLLGNACYRRESFAEDDEILANFIMQYYDSESELADVIYLSFDIEKELLEQYFSFNFKKVKIEYPKSGKDFRIVELAAYNAKDNLLKYLKKKDDKDIKDFPDCSLQIKSDSIASNLPPKDNSDKTEALLKVLCSIRGVGEKKAEKIASKYQNANELINLSIKELSNNCQISLKTATIILNTLKI